MVYRSNVDISNSSIILKETTKARWNAEINAIIAWESQAAVRNHIKCKARKMIQARKHTVRGTGQDKQEGIGKQIPSSMHK